MDRDYLRNQLAGIISLIHQSIFEAPVDANKKQELFMTTLLCSIVENASSIVELLKNEIYTGIPVLVRNSLEAHIDLKNLFVDDEYFKDMITSFSKQEERFFGNANKDNSYFETIIGLDEFAKREKKYEEFVKQHVKSHKSKMPSVLKRFESAGEGDMYYSVYNQLCRDSHNSLDALVERHIKLTENQCHIVLYRRINDAKFFMYIHAMAAMLIDSATLLFMHMDHIEYKISEASEILNAMMKVSPSLDLYQTAPNKPA